MANIIQKVTNTWSKGMVLDFSPENTSNEVLTHALNATLLTFNGNEYSLQNDMGNARVETAYLPEGYIPIGTCEFGGIIYIVSYNPLEDKSQIGCFPSPERNVSNTEMGLAGAIIEASDFQEMDNDSPTGKLNNTSHCVVLKNDPLNPGDKFIITAENSIYKERLADLYNNSRLISHPIIKLNVVSINDSGKITYLNSDLRNYTTEGYDYYILGTSNSMPQQTDIDGYRNVISSGYNVFKSKTSGKLAILAELIMIDSYSVTHSIKPELNNGQWKYNIYLHHEISPEVNENNYLQVPKLKYYYLEKSKGLFSIPMKDYEIRFNPTNIHDKDDPDKNYIKLSEFIESATLTDTDTITGINFQGFQNESMYYYNQYNDKVQYLSNVRTDYKYEDVLLGTVIMPDIINDNTNLSLPFTYEYTIVPCMEYGKLDHLKVSNTINFQNLHNFDQSKINTWKYYLENNLLRLTFGAEVYDTFESNKVDAVILEFYDAEGFAGSYTCANKKSYSGIFTTTFTLNSINQLNTQKIEYVGNKFELVEGEFRNMNLRKASPLVSVKYKYDSESSVIFYNIPTYIYESNTYIKLSQALFNNYVDNARYSTYSPISNEDKIKLKQTQIIEGYYIINDGFIGDLTNSIPNDCGTLYSNLIYKVKPYFRQPNADGTFNYIEQNELYLFTFPIYNQYYYTINNFNTLTYPELDVVLTYQLKDNSNCNIYSNNDNNIINGYNSEDKENINKYYSGTYKESSLEATRYYSYKGTSELYLEIGLHEQYAHWGLSSKKSLNENFTCDLQLIGSDDNSTYDVTNSENLPLDADSTLNIIDNTPQSSLGFDANKLSNKTIDNFDNYNFLSKTPTTPININYEFIAGYKFKITDMVPTAVPTTTVCALCHKVNDLQYNYSDFGIREETIGDVTQYLSDAIIYNSGDKFQTEVGIGHQKHLMDSTIPPSGPKMDDYIYFSQTYSSQTTAVSSKKPLNVGEPMNTLQPYIGKLTFCQPHAHAIDDVYGVNIHYRPWPNENLPIRDGEVPSGFYINSITQVGIIDEQLEMTHGSMGSSAIYDYVGFNLSINTKNSLLRPFEFISAINYADNKEYSITIDYMCQDNDGSFSQKDKSIYARRLALFSPEELTIFNKYLLNSMKTVYAYNPDYDTIVFNKGQVNMQNYHPIFNSNLLIKNAKLNIEDAFNNYININNNGLKEYLTDLVGSNIPEQLQFKPNLKYCGENAMLLTSLTYNTPIPQILIDELNFNPNSLIVVKQHDGTINVIHGNINKKALYGYDPDRNVLAQLNNHNYTINEEGDEKGNVQLLTKQFSQTIVPSNTTHSTKTPISIPTLAIKVYNITETGCIVECNKRNWNYKLQGMIRDGIFESPFLQGPVNRTILNLQDEKFQTYEQYKIIAAELEADLGTEGKCVYVEFNRNNASKFYAGSVNNIPTVNNKNSNPYIIGTNIKLTDLEYDPTQSHRLFLKSELYNKQNMRRLCYRKVYKGSWEEDFAWKEKENGEYSKEHISKNELIFYEGPCFTQIEDPTLNNSIVNE